MDFSKLKKNRGKDLQKLVDKISATEEGKNVSTNVDERFWKLSVDKSKNGSAVIRFLPQTNEDSLPWVQVFSHGFQGSNGWYINNCPTTIGKKCPACEMNKELWDTGVQANQDLVRKQKRKLTYISNIYVVKDSANPENEGKVFLFKFGKQIFDKINDAMNPEFEDEDPINPFDLWEGASFRLKSRLYEGYQNYNKSDFDSVAPLSEDDAYLETIYKSQYDLKEFVSDDQFKSYEELKGILDRAFGQQSVESASAKQAQAANISKAVEAKTASDIDEEIEEDEEEETVTEDSDLEMFKQLANS